MDSFVTVLTSAYPQNLYIIKGRLESEGIHCFLKDELTVQVNNFYSNAVDGVKLQVYQNEADRAIELLKELGYIKDELIKPDLLGRLDAKTAFLPLLKNIGIINRLVILILVTVALITSSLYFIFKPSLVDTLKAHIWTVDKIYCKNKLLTNFRDSTTTFDLKFGENNYLSVPGHDFADDQKWKLENGKIIISAAKTVFDGTYDVDVSGEKLIMKSANTIIYAY